MKESYRTMLRIPIAAFAGEEHGRDGFGVLTDEDNARIKRCGFEKEVSLDHIDDICIGKCIFCIL